MTNAPSQKENTSPKTSITWKSVTLLVFLASVLLVITFPEIRPGFNPKIDPQIHWVFNHLWIHDFAKTQHIIFPHGPLTFINFPLAMEDNLFWGLVWQTVIRIGFIGTFLYLALVTVVAPTRMLLSGLLLFFILEFFKLDYLLVGLVANSLFLCLLTRKRAWYLLALVGMALGMYIKMSIGIMSIALLLPFLVIDFALHRGTIKLLIRLLGIPIVLLGGWWLMYLNFEGFGNYFIGLLELTSGNSDSASVYPDNNWWYLAGSGLCILVIPLHSIWREGIHESNKTILIYLLLGCCTFAVWKHSMAREDPWHIYKIFSWLVLVFSYLIILNKRLNWQAMVLSTIALFFFYCNIKSAVDLFVLKADAKGYQHFSQAFFHQKALFKKYESKSRKSITPYNLSSNDRSIIGKQTTDCYPFNYSLIEGNGFVWQPRPIIQSYAAYTPWLDAQNANHFTSVNAPEYLIWETDVQQRDTWDAELTSIDNHYLLNDEPQTIQAILQNYTLLSKGAGYLLFQKGKTGVPKQPVLAAAEKKSWEEWTTVPYLGDGLLFVKLQFEDRWLKWMKAKLYKDDPLFIEYKLTNGEIRKHRISKQNAEQGIWINPFIHQPSNEVAYALTDRIRFSTGAPELVSPSLQISWQHFPINNAKEQAFPYQNAFQLFGKSTFKEEKKGYTTSDFEATDLLPKSYSSSYELPLEQIATDSLSELFVSASVQAKMNYHAKGNLVIAVQKNGKNLFWQSKKLSDFRKFSNQWELAFLRKELPKSIGKDAVLKVYVWNSGKEVIGLKDLQLTIWNRRN